jgi:hypothetical protein
MTNEAIVSLLKDWLNFSSGLDYYDYTSSQHWWGDSEDLKGFADELMGLLGLPRI